MNKLFGVILVTAFALSACISVDGPRRAVVEIKTRNLSGKISFEQASINSPVKLRGVIFGLDVGVHSVHVHVNNALGDLCEEVGDFFTPTGRRIGERPAGFLGNIKTLPGDPSRTEVNLISVSVSLFDTSPSYVVHRSLVIHVRPDDLSSNNKWNNFEESDILACGRIIDNDSENFELPVKLEKQNPLTNSKNSLKKDLATSTAGSKKLDAPNPEATASAENVWKAGFTYEYDYAGFMTTSMTGISPKMAGGSIKGRLIIEPIGQSLVNVALVDARAKQFNEDVMGEVFNLDPGRETQLMDKEYLEKPFQLKFSAAKVESFLIGREEPLWVMNFKRGLASQIQLQLNDASGVFNVVENEDYYSANAYYQVSEGSVTGDCKVDYYVNRIPEEHFEPRMIPAPQFCLGYPLFEVTKTRDLDKCIDLPMFNQINVPGVNCNITSSAGCGNAMSRTDTVRVIGCTSEEGQFIVQRIKATDKLVSKLLGYETEASEGQAVQLLHLVSIRKTDIHTLALSSTSEMQVYHNLVYSYDIDHVARQEGMMNKHGLTKRSEISFSEMKYSSIELDKDTLYREAVRLFIEIVKDLESDDYYADPVYMYLPEKFSNLRSVFTHFDYPLLKRFVEKYFEDNDPSTPKQILVDTLVYCGTSPAFDLLRELIVTKRINGERALQAVSHLPGTIEAPTLELLGSFFELLTSETVISNLQLKITTALSLTRLVYQACINATISTNRFPNLAMGKFCRPADSIITDQLVPWLVRELNKTDNPGEVIAHLTALGNIGHELIVPHIKPYISSCQPSTLHEKEWLEKNKDSLLNMSRRQMKKKYLEANAKNAENFDDVALCNIIRSKAIFSLHHLALTNEETVHTLLAPIAFNKAEETEVRLAAWSVLFLCNPTQTFWNRAALSTWHEPNTQIAHFIYTTIASIVFNKDPTKRDEVVRAEAAVPLMKPMHWTSYVALNYHMAGYTEKIRLGYTAKFVNFPGYESFVPSHHYSALSVLLGPLTAKLGEVSIFSRHAEKFVDGLIGKPGLRFKLNAEEASISSPELENIKDQLKIQARATGRPEIFVYVNYLDNYQRFYTISPSTITETIDLDLIQKILKSGIEPLDFNIHKFTPLINGFYRIPSSMGFAYSVVVQSSLLFSLNASAKFDISVVPLGAKLENTVKPVAQVNSITKVLGELPFSRSYAVAGVQGNVAFTAPGRFFADVSLSTSKFQATWEFLDNNLRIGHMSITPYTSIREIGDFSPCRLIPETKIAAGFGNPKKEEYAFDSFVESLGLRFLHLAEGDKNAFKAPKAYNEELLGFLTFSAFPTSVRYFSQSLFLDSARSETKAVKFSMALVPKAGLETEDPLSVNPHSKSLVDAIYGKGAASNDFSRQQGIQIKQLLYKKLQHLINMVNNPAGYTADLAVEFISKSSSTIRRLDSSITYSKGSLRQRGSVKVKRDNREQQDDVKFVFCAELVSQNFKRMKRKTEAEHRSTFAIGFGKSCTKDRQIAISTTFSREEDFVRSELVKAQRKKCHKERLNGQLQSEDCVMYSRLYTIFNKATVEIEYNEMPAFVTNATVKIDNMFRFWWGAYMNDNQIGVKNEEGKVVVEVLYDPTVGFADIEVHKPHSDTFFRALKVHPTAVVILPQSMISPRPFLAGPGVCTVARKYVYTFDGLLYNATIGGCDLVLAMDCSGRHKFAVLAHEEGGNKIVTILLNGEKIEINPAIFNARVNGVDHAVTEHPHAFTNAGNETYAIIKVNSDNFVEFESPHSHLVRVMTDAEEVVITSSPLHRGRMCGLCGSLTGDKLTDLMGPRQCSIPRDFMDVAYQLKAPTGCHSPTTSGRFLELHRMQKECLRRREDSVFGISGF